VIATGALLDGTVGFGAALVPLIGPNIHLFLDRFQLEPASATA
jgi:hypothetical protein